MDKPYEAKRWHDNPGMVVSLCGDCENWLGFGKCKKYEDKVPKEVLEKSYPKTEKFKINYCKYRKVK